MVKIYTKTGDKGETGLLSGARVLKNHPQIEAYGTVDECNSAIGFASSFMNEENTHGLHSELTEIQESLFELGAALAAQLSQSNKSILKFVRVDYDADIRNLEKWIDAMTEQLSPLKHFILPGGTPVAGGLHLARTCCRRAERLVIPLLDLGDANISMLSYLNRLSDYLFTASRFANFLAKVPDKEWIKKKEGDQV